MTENWVNLAIGYKAQSIQYNVVTKEVQDKMIENSRSHLRFTSSVNG